MKHKFVLFFFLAIQISIQANAKVNSNKSESKSIFFLDGHNHQGFSKLDKDSICFEMMHLKKLGYDAIVFQLPIDRSKRNRLSSQEIWEDIETIKELSVKSNCFDVVDSISELENRLTDDEILCLFSIEYFHGIFDKDLNVIPQYKNSGVAYITLVDSFKDSLFIKTDNKYILREYGQNVIRKMNDANITIDISHLNENQMIEVINYSKSPVMASHTNAKSVTSLSYNLSDTVLMSLSKKRGLVLLSFNNNGLYSSNDQKDDPIKKFADHIDYVKKIIAINQIGIGTDLQAFGKYIPSELYKANTVGELIAELVNRNYSEKEIEKIFYSNYINFMKKN